jgi:hypothetical protein
MSDRLLTTAKNGGDSFPSANTLRKGAGSTLNWQGEGSIATSPEPRPYRLLRPAGTIA